jgi:hypothetical protein
MSRLFQILTLCALFFTTTLTTACGGDEDAKKAKAGKMAKAGKSTAPKCQIKGLKSCQKASDCFPTPEEDYFACEQSCCKSTL